MHDTNSFISTTGITYKDDFCLDQSFPSYHVNYNNSPLFNGRRIDQAGLTSLEATIPSEGFNSEKHDVMEFALSYDDLAKSCDPQDLLELWKAEWLEYFKAFDKLACQLRESIVSLFLGRHALELGFKYLRLKQLKAISFTHNLAKLSSGVFDNSDFESDSLGCILSYLDYYQAYIEGNTPEYFRYPEYKKDGKPVYFGGIHLSINAIIQDIALANLKLIHFAGLDKEAGI